MEVYKRCKACKQVKELWEFNVREKKHYTSKNPSHYRSDCNACRGKNQYVRILDRKIQAYPHLYLECDECDIPYSKKFLRCPRCYPVVKVKRPPKEKPSEVIQSAPSDRPQNAVKASSRYPVLINPWTKEETPSEQLIGSLEGVDSFNEVMRYNDVKRDLQITLFTELFNR